ncbi:OmpH family outer membrane protein [Allopusillimonas soli]|uniref:OmpH family outer membrane protein n=1 Tax=Allopusillimonas soli TaxID=659016 RepID=A0A853FA80_9BURK|nr:OmpH family outer membrane protein [Allopusillimonas soli]NYT36688.1 OmpH family outer membrane protein [Allopusillimonas soli]TEA75168.1 OmpH family outer membrane protein [Allopusillimonas soli]
MKSQFALKVSSTIQGLARGNRALVLAAVLGLGAAIATPVQAQGTKIGFVSTERILRDSKPAKAAQAKIEAEFKGRDQELQNLANKLRSQAQKFDKDAPVLSESDRIKRQRQLAELDSDLQRKRREFQEDFNRRRNEEFSHIVEKADAAIKKIAEQQGYDLIIQDAVTVSPRVDITDQVMKALGG